MLGVRAVLDGRGGAGAVGGVLLDAVSGAGLPREAGVAEGRYGNAVAERLGRPSGPGCRARVGWRAGSWLLPLPVCACRRGSRPRHREG